MINSHLTKITKLFYLENLELYGIHTHVVSIMVIAELWYHMIVMTMVMAVNPYIVCQPLKSGSLINVDVV